MNSEQHDRNMVKQARQQHNEDKERAERLRAEKEQIERNGQIRHEKRYTEIERELPEAERNEKASKTSVEKLEKNYSTKHGGKVE